MPFQLTRGTWLALAALGPAIYVAIQLLPILRSVFLLLLVVALLALLINPLADRLGRRGVARGLTVALALGGTALLLVGLLLLLLPAIFDSLGKLSSSLGPLSAELSAWLVRVTGSGDVAAVGGQLVGQVSGAVQWAAGQFGSVLGQIGALGFGLFVAAACVLALVGQPATGPALLRVFVPARYHA